MPVINRKSWQSCKYFAVVFIGCLIWFSFPISALKSNDVIGQVCNTNTGINTLILSDSSAQYDSIFRPLTSASSSTDLIYSRCSILFQAAHNDSVFLVRLSRLVELLNEVVSSGEDLRICANGQTISYVSEQRESSDQDTFSTSERCLVLNITLPRSEEVNETRKKVKVQVRQDKSLIVVTSMSRTSHVCNLMTRTHCSNNACVLASLFCDGGGGVPNCSQSAEEHLCNLYTLQPMLNNPSASPDSATDDSPTLTGELMLWLALFGIVMAAILVILWVHYRSGSVIRRARGYTRSRAEASFSYKLHCASNTNKNFIAAFGALFLCSHLVAASNNTSPTNELLTDRPSIVDIAPSATRPYLVSPTHSPSGTFLDKLGVDATTASYTNRLDFISVIVICSIFLLCFIVCIVIGCRRRKRRAPPEELITSQAYSDTESRNVEVRNAAGQLDRNANSSSAGRQVESPPPTYSVIERQTSFTSYVSQTSSQFEIPPEYDEDWVPGDPAQSNIRRSVRPGSRSSRASNRTNEPPTSTTAVSTATSGAASASSRPLRSESARARGPPKVRPFRSGSEAGRQRRQRASARPTTVSEDDGFSQSDELNSDASAAGNIPPREAESLSPDNESGNVLVQVEAAPPTGSSASDASRNVSHVDSATSRNV